MKRFWATYLLTAVIGTVAIYFGAPMIASKLARPTPPVPSSATHPTVSEIKPARPLFRRISAAALTSTVGQTEPRAPGVTHSRDVTNTNTGDLPASTREGTVSAVPSYRPPDSDPSAPSWAILTRQASHYSTDGKNLGPLPAGTVGEVTRTTTSSRGDFAVCTVDHNGQWKGPVLIGVEYLILFEGPLTAVPTEPLSLLHHYYALKGRIDARSATLQQQHAPGNPHVAAHTRAVNAGTEFTSLAKRRVAAMNAASGPKRSELLDELKQMKFEQARLNSERQQAEARMKEWDAQNPRQTRAPVDPELNDWLAELRRLEPEKQAVIP